MTRGSTSLSSPQGSLWVAVIALTLVLVEVITAAHDHSAHRKQKQKDAVMAQKKTAPMPKAQAKAVQLPPAPRQPEPKPTRPPEAQPPAPTFEATNATPPKPESAQGEPPSPPSLQASTQPEIETAGRTLLKLLEHGSGPRIEIAWPERQSQRAQLARLLSRCYRMNIALVDEDGGLYRAAGVKGQPWRPNLDRISGFVRQPQGSLTTAEREQGASIAAYHGMNASTRILRTFAREADARLLGGLKHLVGETYGSAQHIGARYSIKGPRLFITDIRRDGQPVAGRIDLTPAEGCP